jgi:hypothetical protein
MLKSITPPLADLVRSMQYMSVRNGGLLIDFTPIASYAEIARGAPPHERVRTVLDWISFATEAGLLAARSWHQTFQQEADFAAFAAELREYDVAPNPRHGAAFCRLGLTRTGRLVDYARLADAIDAARLRRVAA